MKKWLLLLLLACLILSGCEFKDIDKRFFITAIGIDQGQKGKKYRVSLKLSIPKGQLEMGKEDYLTLSYDSNSISDAVQKLKTRVDKEFEFGHTKVLLFGESLAQKGYSGALDWYSRQRYIQKIAWMGVATPSAEELLRGRQESERMPANALIMAFGNQAVESQYIVSQYLYQMYARYKEPTRSPILPLIEPLGNGVGQYYKIDRAVVLDDHKIRLQLTPGETKYFNVLSGGTTKWEIGVKEGQNIYTIHSENSRAKLSLDGSMPTVDLYVKGILEEEENPVPFSHVQLAHLETLVERSTTDYIQKLLRKLQKADIDPLGFGEIYRLHHWDDFEKEVADWKKMYPHVTFKVNVRCELRSPGTIK